MRVSLYYSATKIQLGWRNDFVGQVNHFLCCVQKQCSGVKYVKYKLFQAYCTSLYGCELCNLAIHGCDNSAISNHCSVGLVITSFMTHT